MKDTGQVIGVTLGAISLTLTQLNLIIQIIAGIIAIIFTLWKWYKAIKQDEKL